MASRLCGKVLCHKFESVPPRKFIQIPKIDGFSLDKILFSFKYDYVYAILGIHVKFQGLSP